MENFSAGASSGEAGAGCVAVGGSVRGSFDSAAWPTQANAATSTIAEKAFRGEKGIVVWRIMFFNACYSRLDSHSRVRKDALDLHGWPDWVVREEVRRVTCQSSNCDKSKLLCVH
jgi:hypothetical protein